MDYLKVKCKENPLMCILQVLFLVRKNCLQITHNASCLGSLQAVLSEGSFRSFEFRSELILWHWQFTSIICLHTNLIHKDKLQMILGIQLIYNCKIGPFIFMSPRIYKLLSKHSAFAINFFHWTKFACSSLNLPAKVWRFSKRITQYLNVP